MRASASMSRSRYTRTRGASIASWTFIPNSSTLRSICAVVCRIPYEPGVPIERKKFPSWNTWVGDIIVPALRPARTTFGDAGSRSIHLRMLLSTSPVPGMAKPEPNGTPSVCVTETTMPLASAHAKCVVCSSANFAGWPSAIWFGSRELHRLDEVVKVLDGVVPPRANVIALEDVERLQHLKGRERRRHRIDLLTAIRDRRRRAPLRLERGEVVFAEPPARLAHGT